MASPDYYRRQAQIFASMALASRDPSVVTRYNTMALEYLAKAHEADPLASSMQPTFAGDGGSDMDRD